MDDQITIASTELTGNIGDPNYSGSVTVDMSSLDASLYSGMNYTTTASCNYGNISIGNGGNGLSNYAIGSSYQGSLWSTSVTTDQAGVLQVHGEDADVMLNGKSLKNFMETMEKRLAILTPDLEKLEHFAALKKAYENYKTLEALCELPKEEDGN